MPPYPIDPLVAWMSRIGGWGCFATAVGLMIWAFYKRKIMLVSDHLDAVKGLTDQLAESKREAAYWRGMTFRSNRLGLIHADLEQQRLSAAPVAFPDEERTS